MPDEVDPRFERYRIPEERGVYGEALKPYDPSREERRTEQDTNLYKEYGFAMTESQKELEDLYKKSTTGITDIYTPVTDFDKAYAEWYKAGSQPEIFRSGSGTTGATGYIGQGEIQSGDIQKVGEQYYIGTAPYEEITEPLVGLFGGSLTSSSLPTYRTREQLVTDPETGTTSSTVESFIGINSYIDANGTPVDVENWVQGDLNYKSIGTTQGLYIPKELTDPELVRQYLQSPAEWEAAFKEKWYETSPAAYSEANIKFYEAITKIEQEKTEIYNQLGIRTNNRLYLDESNNYDRTVMNMQQRFEDRIAQKQAMLNELLQVK